MSEESEERRRSKRIRQEAEYHAQQAYWIAFSIWNAVEDLDEVPENLHLSDVVEKHIQRGNIRRDGGW